MKKIILSITILFLFSCNRRPDCECYCKFIINDGSDSLKVSGFVSLHDETKCNVEDKGGYSSSSNRIYIKDDITNQEFITRKMRGYCLIKKIKYYFDIDITEYE